MPMMISEVYKQGLPLPSPNVDPDVFVAHTLSISGRLLNGPDMHIDSVVRTSSKFQVISGLHLLMSHSLLASFGMPDGISSRNPSPFFFIELVAPSTLAGRAEAFNETSQQQATDILCTDGSISVILQRVVETHGFYNLHFDTKVATAKLWKRSDLSHDTGDGYKNVLQGELMVPSTLTADFKFPNLCIGVRFIPL